MIEAYLEILELSYYEVTFAFKGLSDENVWKRPADGLLSIGELAGHIAYWEALKFASEIGPESEVDPAKCRVASPLIDRAFRYYSRTVAEPPSDKHLTMTADQVCQELLRVHQEAMADFKGRNPGLDTVAPGWPPYFTYRELLKYAAFHVSYHTGQMYSARHLLGESPPDN